jgi:hypothetical protein
MTTTTAINIKLSELWGKACEYDNVPTTEHFVNFSAANPYVKEYNRIMRLKMAGSSLLSQRQHEIG